MPTPEEFIYLVLDRWRIARALDNAVRRTPDLESKFQRHRSKAQVRNRDYLQLACEASALNDLLTSLRPLGRKKATASRKRFMKGWSDKFRELCGDPLDEVVRVLTEVCSGKDATVGEVRAARREWFIRPPK